MSHRDRVVRDLFARWVASAESGSGALDPRDLCREQPELLPSLETLIDNYRLAEAMLRPIEPAGSSSKPPVTPEPVPERIGRYRVDHELGRGGMGVVYSAFDDQLGRPVAVKTVTAAIDDETARKRLWREARAVARVQHPNVCHLYEIVEESPELFLVMELLEGESLAERLARGAIPFSEAIDIALEALSALGALHREGLLHRDLKPSNVFLTPHGVKVLDFGLVRALGPDVGHLDASIESQLTATGAIAGTPSYMAPEQLHGGHLDARTDLFALGAVIFEMLTGSRAFPGESLLEISHRILHLQPPALGGSPAADAVDRVVRRALSKNPDDRYAGADEMAMALSAVTGADDAGGARAHAMTRLMVLPFHVLRPDPETDFLAMGIPEAITSALTGLESLVVRSSAAAARFAAERLDPQRIAETADVDVVVTGSLLRAGEQIRVTTQLVEVPGGATLRSLTHTVEIRDIFELQDRIVDHIVESLSLSLTAREHQRLKADVPASSTAYEFFLRANQLVLAQGVASADSLSVARDLYQRSVEEDPRYAPAWARLGRCHWLIGKGGEDVEENIRLADRCLRRALELSPDLPLAHRLLASRELDQGHSREAMVRLVRQGGSGRADPELFAGLVTACRYCGLHRASEAAHARAEQLDRRISTSVAFTYYQQRNLTRAFDCVERSYYGVTSIASLEVRAALLFEMGRRDEAIRGIRKLLDQPLTDFFRLDLQFFLALFEGRREACCELAARAISEFWDAEGILYVGRGMALLGERDLAIAALRRCVDRGFVVFPALFEADPWFDAVQGDDAFENLLREGEARRLQAATAFRDAGGDRLLGVDPA